MYDCIIIGQGPCGITTAVYLKRFGYKVCIIAKDYGALEKAEKIENYYGFLPISGTDLIKSGIKQAEELGIEIFNEEMLDISVFDGLKVRTTKGEYNTKTIMLAMGKSRARHYLAKDFEGKGVSYCATCDGFFYRKKPIAVIGNSNYMLEEYNVLKNLTNDITIFTDGKELEVEIENAKVCKGKIVKFLGDENSFKGIKTTDNEYELKGCFIALGSASGFSLASHLGLGVENENILVDSNYMTNINGIFAGGDLIGGLLQVAKAVSDGANAAVGIKKYLSNK